MPMWEVLALIGAGLTVSLGVSVVLGRLLRRTNRHYPSPARPARVRIRELLRIDGGQ